MLETLLNISNDGSISTRETIISMVFALIIGLIIAVAYTMINKKEKTSISFVLTLVILPAIVALVIVLIGSNMARALSIAGVFTLVRFRSAPGDGKDISFVFLAMAGGLAAGLGFFTVAFVATLVMAVVIVVAFKLFENVFKDDTKQLRIIIPEDMDYNGVFDSVFDAYTTKASLDRVKTTNMGTLYELTYHVEMKPNADEKKFIDELRIRNGNLMISLTKQMNKDVQL